MPRLSWKLFHFVMLKQARKALQRVENKTEGKEQTEEPKAEQEK